MVRKNITWLRDNEVEIFQRIIGNKGYNCFKVLLKSD